VHADEIPRPRTASRSLPRPHESAPLPRCGTPSANNRRPHPTEGSDARDDSAHSPHPIIESVLPQFRHPSPCPRRARVHARDVGIRVRGRGGRSHIVCSARLIEDALRVGAEQALLGGSGLVEAVGPTPNRAMTPPPAAHRTARRILIFFFWFFYSSFFFFFFFVPLSPPPPPRRRPAARCPPARCTMPAAVASSRDSRRPTDRQGQSPRGCLLCTNTRASSSVGGRTHAVAARRRVADPEISPRRQRAWRREALGSGDGCRTQCKTLAIIGGVGIGAERRAQSLPSVYAAGRRLFAAVRPPPGTGAFRAVVEDFANPFEARFSSAALSASRRTGIFAFNRDRCRSSLGERTWLI